MCGVWGGLCFPCLQPAGELCTSAGVSAWACVGVREYVGVRVRSRVCVRGDDRLLATRGAAQHRRTVRLKLANDARTGETENAGEGERR